MTNEAIIAIKEDRYKRLMNSPKNIKSPGVVRKLAREIRNLKK
jgi:hypothetical protein